MSTPRLAIAGLVAIFLAAIVAANLISTSYGPEASIYSAFFLIGLDLTTRDALHDFWGDRPSRYAKLAALILVGALLSYVINQDAATIARASALSFAAATAADTLVYALLRRAEWLERVNGSNVVGAAVDSVLFPTLAFGGFMWGITLGQFTAKVAGGLLWSMALRRAVVRRPAEARG